MAGTRMTNTPDGGTSRWNRGTDMNREQRIKEIEKTVIIEPERLEPVDSEGKEMEGEVFYQGRLWFVYLSFYDEESYELQAARQIAENS